MPSIGYSLCYLINPCPAGTVYSLCAGHVGTGWSSVYLILRGVPFDLQGEGEGSKIRYIL